MALSSAEFMSLARAASLGPSADNQREFQLEHIADQVRLWARDEFLSVPRHRRFLGLQAMSASVENMRLRAAALGFGMAVRWFPDDQEPRLITELDFDRRSDLPEEPLERVIEQRHTNRRPVFRGPALPAEELRAFSSVLADLDGITLHWCDAPAVRQQIVRLIRIAETERFRSQKLHEEVLSAVRFDVGWTASSDNGIPPGALEVEPLMRPLFKALASWDHIRRLHRVGAHHILGFRSAYAPCRLAPHVGVLSTSLDGDASAVAAGTAFERVWLQATLSGLEFQPFAASAMYSLPVADWVRPEVRNTLSAGWDRLIPGRSPMMVFRMGRAPQPSCRTSREPVEAYCYCPHEESSAG